jgi:hypothetical protein
MDIYKVELVWMWCKLSYDLAVAGAAVGLGPQGSFRGPLVHRPWKSKYYMIPLTD